LPHQCQARGQAGRATWGRLQLVTRPGRPGNRAQGGAARRRVLLEREGRQSDGVAERRRGAYAHGAWVDRLTSFYGIALQAFDPFMAWIEDFRPPATAIPVFYGVGLLAHPAAHFTSTDFWRFWVVHLWVEDFLELFTTIMVAYIFVLLGVVREGVALTIVYLDMLPTRAVKSTSSRFLAPVGACTVPPRNFARFVTSWRAVTFG